MTSRPGPTPWAHRRGETLALSLRVRPGARRSGVIGVHGPVLKVQVAAPADDGKANAELVRFLAEALGVPRRSVTIRHGHRGRDKTVEVPGTCDLSGLTPT